MVILTKLYFWSLPTYLVLTCLLAYLLTDLLTNLLTYLLNYLPTNVLTYLIKAGLCTCLIAILVFDANALRFHF